MDRLTGLQQELLQELARIPTVDAHEHLTLEEVRLQQQLDFFSLFEHYCIGDLVAAGMSADVLKGLRERKGTLALRWSQFKPYWSAIRTTGYARAALFVIRDILEVSELTDATYEVIGERLQEANRPGRYDEILRQRCNLVACIQCWHHQEEGPSYFYHLVPSHVVVDLTGASHLAEVKDQAGMEISCLADYLDAMTVIVEQWKDDPKVVGIKSGHAYRRSIAFAQVERATAERLFQRLLGQDALKAEEKDALQDFLMFELVARAAAVDLPMVFHTGLQAGNQNDIRNANPLGLLPLLRAFPQAKFDLFHGGMPWVRETAILAKHFPGVHLNMAWMNIISPAQSRSALSEWLDLVPNTKIFGFGGDYNIVEKVYGHLKLTRQNIARVLAEKIVYEDYGMDEALLVARRLLLDNPNRFYCLPTSC